LAAGGFAAVGFCGVFGDFSACRNLGIFARMTAFAARFLARLVGFPAVITREGGDPDFQRRSFVEPKGRGVLGRAAATTDTGYLIGVLFRRAKVASSAGSVSFSFIHTIMTCRLFGNLPLSFGRKMP